jgi:Tol biopolymer transport system component
MRVGATVVIDPNVFPPSPELRTRIAFVRAHSNDVDGEIYTVNLDGTGLTQVTHAPGSNSPDWGTHPPVG